MNDDLAPSGKNPTIAAFESYVNANGDQEAIVAEDRHLTYAQLSQRAHKLASWLQGRSKKTCQPVLALLENDIDRCIALLGVHLAGQIYLPLDPKNPEARLVLMLQTARSGSLVVDRRTAALAQRLVDVNLSLFNLNEIEPVVTPVETTHLYDPQALAWIIFTSGSTGQPKGVMQTYQNCSFYRRQAIESLHLGPGERFAVASPLTSQAGVVSTMAVLSSGGTLFFMEPGRRSASTILEWLADQRITILLIAPTVFRRVVVNPEAKEQMDSLRILRLTGEPVTKLDVDLFNQYCHSDCILSIGYGTTETGSISQAFFKHPASVDSRYVTVGTSQQKVEISLIDENDQPVAMNKPGEIVVKSKHLSPGYWDMPELTSLVFSDTPDGQRLYRTGDLGILHPDGSLEHIGRKDSQIQILGQRVEISEIEVALRSIPFVKEAAVHCYISASEEQRLVAFVAIKKTSGFGSKEIREALTLTLPGYMIPHNVTVLESLPLTRTGKIDRRALAEIDPVTAEGGTSYIGPRTDTERLLAAIWAIVLGIERVGIYTNFFELGGDSLIAVQIANQIQQEFLIELSMREILTSATIAELAIVVDGKRLNTLQTSERTP